MKIVDANPTDNGSCERALAALSDDGGGIVRIRPGREGDGYPLLDWVISPLPETCEREDLGLAIDYHPGDIPWQDVVGFARAYPGLPMILIGPDPMDVVIPAALNAAPNLIVQLRGTSDIAGLARRVDRLGAHRFTPAAAAVDPRRWREAYL